MAGICGITRLDGQMPPSGGMAEWIENLIGNRSAEYARTSASGLCAIGCSEPDPSDSLIDDGGIIVAAEGRIYDPAGSGPARTIAELYRRYGEGCAEKMDGDFSFCVWDREKSSLTISTGCFGAKSVYYYHGGGYFVFASKIKALLGAGIFSPSIDKDSLYKYCVFTFVPEPDTIYKEVKKLPAGHTLTVCNGKVSVRKYWDIHYVDGKSRGEEYYAAKIREEMENAVKKRFDPSADLGHTGAFLSGGLDSSVVAGLMRKIAGSEVKTFSVGFEEPRYSEIEYVNIAARHFGLKSYQYIVKPHELEPAVEALAGAYDEPFGNSSAIAAYYCMKMAADKGVKVLLGGDGGDENLGGYTRYVTDKIYGAYQHIPGFLRNMVLEPLVFKSPLRGTPLFIKAKNYIEHSNLPVPERFCFYELYSMRERSVVFSEDFLGEVDPLGPLKVLERYYGTSGTSHRLNRLTYLDSKVALIGNDISNKMGKVSGVVGVETRFPMLDRRLWDLGAVIPASLKVKGLTKKYIYKKAFGNFLPREIITKKKHGFGLPFAVWLREDRSVRKFAEGMLLDPGTAKRGYFRKGFFEDMLKAHDNEKTSYYGEVLWPFLMLEVWLREHEGAGR